LNKNLRNGALIALVLVLLVLGKWQPWKSAPAASSAAALRNAVTNVKAYVTKYDRLENVVSTSGTIKANEEVELRSEISGKINRIYFHEGSRVKRGDLLLSINDADLQAQLQRAESQKKLAEDQELRLRQQLEIEAVSQDAYDAALARLNTTIADLQLIRAQIEKSRVISPFDGVIGLRYVSEGSYISPNSQIAYLLDADPVKIDFGIPEKYASLAEVGQTVTFRIQGSSEIFTGKVYAMEPAIDENTRSLNVRAVYPNSDGRIKPGSFADIQITLKSIDNAIMIPNQALVPDIIQQRVFLVKDGKSMPVPIEIGLRTSDKLQVIRGLQTGDTVITTGLLQIRPGGPVRITELN